jgi:spermidine/putrescine ABC transporter ATP-binding subunit
MALDTKGASLGLENLKKHYGSVIAVDNVSLTIRAGEFITLLGPSGSGKTTTLLMVAGFEAPDAGTIFVDDELILLKPAYKREMGMVFQHYSLFPHMTVEQNIGFPLRMRSVAPRERGKRIGEALELVRLTGYEKRYPRQLSGGQQQRIALARALVFNPRVLLMDEPLGALDKKLREIMQIEIKQIAQYLNITVLYVTHDQSEAMTLSDRIAVMNSGQIQQVDSPSEIYDNPANYFVADFIGESNFIPGSIVKVEDRICFFASPDGSTFRASYNQEKTPGEKVHLLLRPEKISFVNPGQPHSNGIEVTIEALFYMGDFTIYKVVSRDGTKLTIKQQNKCLNRRVQIGERIEIGWDEQDCCIV